MTKIDIDEALIKFKTVIEGKDKLKQEYLYREDTAWYIIEELTKKIIGLEYALEAALRKDEEFRFGPGDS